MTLIQPLLFMLNITAIGRHVHCLLIGYSCADMKNVCREAAMGPIRDLRGQDIMKIVEADLRRVEYADFQQALASIKATVGKEDIQPYIDWNNKFGSG